MLDIGWSEMLLIAVIAIVVIGPKDLPKALRTVGQWVGKARSIAREFQNSVDQMVADAELDEVKKTANAIGDYRPDTYLKKQLDGIGDSGGDSMGDSGVAAAADAADSGTGTAEATENAPAESAPGEDPGMPPPVEPTIGEAAAFESTGGEPPATEPVDVGRDYVPPEETTERSDERAAAKKVTAAGPHEV